MNDNNIHKIKKNIEDLLIDRGDDVSTFNHDKYEIKNYFMSDVNINEYIYHVSNNTCVIFTFNVDRKKKLMSDIKIKEWSESAKIVSSFINKFDSCDAIAKISNKEEFESRKNVGMPSLSFIFVFGTALTPTDKMTLQNFELELKKLNGLLTIYMASDLYFNPTKHELVSKHRKLSIDESKQVMEKYMIKQKSNMLSILKTDPIAKWLGLRSGDIVEVDRYNKNSGLSKIYRCCV